MQLFQLSMIGCLAFTLAACSAKENDTQPTKTQTVASSTQITATAPSTPQPPRQEEQPNALSGSTWKLSEFEITFRDNTRVLVKGGELGKLNPSGVEGRYTLKEGVLTISVMGQSRTGTFDDKGLIVEGATGEKVK